MNLKSIAAQDLGVLILAAGRSARMGRPKLLLEWGETSVLGHQLRVWQQLGSDQIVVVFAAKDSSIRAELARLRVPGDARIPNPEPDRGMFSSIKCAAQWTRWCENLARVVIVLGDQPHVRHETLRRLLEFSASHPNQVCQPRSSGRLGHPVILPMRVFAPIAGSDAVSLREYLRAHGGEVAACDLADPGLGFDIDTPEDYQRALALCFPNKRLTQRCACQRALQTPPPIGPGT